MTDTSKDAVERLLDGVTDGPWHAESGHRQTNGQLYWQVTDGNDAIVQNQFCWCQGDHNANARFIAASRELVPALLAEREALTAEVARLTEALEFYGDEAAWNQPPVETVQTILGPAYRSAASKMQMDRGKIARDALAAYAARREGGAE